MKNTDLKVRSTKCEIMQNSVNNEEIACFIIELYNNSQELLYVECERFSFESHGRVLEKYMWIEGYELANTTSLLPQSTRTIGIAILCSELYGSRLYEDDVIWLVLRNEKGKYKYYYRMVLKFVRVFRINQLKENYIFKTPGVVCDFSKKEFTSIKSENIRAGLCTTVLNNFINLNIVDRICNTQLFSNVFSYDWDISSLEMKQMSLALGIEIETLMEYNQSISLDIKKIEMKLIDLTNSQKAKWVFKYKDIPYSYMDIKYHSYIYEFRLNDFLSRGDELQFQIEGEESEVDSYIEKYYMLYIPFYGEMGMRFEIKGLYNLRQLLLKEFDIQDRIIIAQNKEYENYVVHREILSNERLWSMKCEIETSNNTYVKSYDHGYPKIEQVLKEEKRKERNILASEIMNIMEYAAEYEDINWKINIEIVDDAYVLPSGRRTNVYARQEAEVAFAEVLNYEVFLVKNEYSIRMKLYSDDLRTITFDEGIAEKVWQQYVPKKNIEYISF